MAERRRRSSGFLPVPRRRGRRSTWRAPWRRGSRRPKRAEGDPREPPGPRGRKCARGRPRGAPSAPGGHQRRPPVRRRARNPRPRARKVLAVRLLREGARIACGGFRLLDRYLIVAWMRMGFKGGGGLLGGF